MDPIGLGLLGMAGLILVKEAGVPVPVPGDLVVVGAGIAAANGDLDPLSTLAAILVAGLVGGTAQYLLVRGAGRRPVLALLARFGVPAARLEAVSVRLRHRGATGVAVARATPGVRIVAIAAAGLATIRVDRFLVGLAAGNGVFVSGHFLAGMLVGPPALAALSGLAAPVIAIVAALATLGAAGWWVVRRRRRGASSAVGDWTDAACPACLLLGAVARADAPQDPLLG